MPAPTTTTASPERPTAQARLQQQLRIIALFEDLPDADLARVAAACSTGTYAKHEQILGDHDATTDVFFVLSGAVRVNSYAESGREVIFSEVGAGDIFGEFAAVDGLPRSAAVVAQSDCVLARMPATKFLEILRHNGAVSVHLVELLVAKIRRMSERVFEVSALAVRERVRRELLRVVVHLHRGERGALRLHLGHAEHEQPHPRQGGADRLPGGLDELLHAQLRRRLGIGGRHATPLPGG